MRELNEIGKINMEDETANTLIPYFLGLQTNADDVRHHISKGNYPFNNHYIGSASLHIEYASGSNITSYFN